VIDFEQESKSCDVAMVKVGRKRDLLLPSLSLMQRNHGHFLDTNSTKLHLPPTFNNFIVCISRHRRVHHQHIRHHQTSEVLSDGAATRHTALLCFPQGDRETQKTFV
jgi:hypothetical protein